MMCKNVKEKDFSEQSEISWLRMIFEMITEDVTHTSTK